MNFTDYFFIFSEHIESEKKKYKDNENKINNSKFNRSYLSIGSDMHFNNLKNYEKIKLLQSI